MTHPFKFITVRVVVLLGFSSLLVAQQPPAQIQPPPTEQLFLTVHAKGDQVYTCKTDGQQFAWSLKGPEALLYYADGHEFGKQLTSSSWMATDSSRVNAKEVAGVPAPDPTAIPWLLFRIVRHDGNGVLSRATSVQRLNTKGGVAPSRSCDAANVNTEFRAAFTADYLFFAPK